MDWTLLIFSALLALSSGQETCLSVDDDPYLLFGSKTAYIFANKGSHLRNRAHDVPGCQPIAFWLLNRHGSHNPEADEIEELQRLTDLKNNIINNYRIGNFRNSNHRMCTSDFNLLERWQWNPRRNITFAGDLTSDGYITTQQLAQAWRQKYPGLLTDNRHDYLFKYANNQRSSTTYRAFTEGLFKTLAETYELPKENGEDRLFPYKYCDGWKKNVEENKETLAQREIFESKQKFKEMITNVSLRLGFNYDVEPQIVRSMYQMCRYNKAWDVSQISPWCASFTTEDLKRLEYAEDLETYYKYGHGNQFNKNVGCFYVTDMLNFFKKHVENELPQQPRVMVQMDEAPGILLALAALKAHEDSAPLTGDNYHTPSVQARKWTTSTMSPFNANLAAILYKCTLNGNFQINDKYQVLLLENEKPLNLEGCRVGLCDWSHVTRTLGALLDTCTVNTCVNTATRFANSLGLGVLLASFVLVIAKL